MNHPSPIIEEVTLSQFIFHLYRGLGSKIDTSVLDNIPHISLEYKAEIRSILQALNKRDHLSNDGPQPILPDLEGFTMPLEDNWELTPFLINDTIFLQLSITFQNTPVSSLSNQISPPKSSLGHCIFIDLKSDRIDQEFADSLMRAIVNTNISCKREETLLGSPIREYADGKTSYYLWIINNEKTIIEESKADYYLHLINMLCCRAKVEYAMRESEECYRRGFECYNAIEARLDAISRLDADSEKRLNGCIDSLPTPIKNQIDTQSSLPPQLQKLSHPSCRKLIRDEQAKRIGILEDHLKVLPQTSYELARYERDLNTHLLTLDTNSYNLQKSSGKLSTDGKDSFLQEFLEQECIRYRQQIIKHIAVLSPGQRFADQFINSIRGIVELDSQKQQLELEEEEKEREKSLEKILATIGFGLGVSGIASQVVNKPVEGLVSDHLPKVNNIPPMGLWFLNIGIHVVLGLLSSGLIWGIWSLGSKRKHQTTPNLPDQPQHRLPRCPKFSIPLKTLERERTTIKKE